MRPARFVLLAGVMATLALVSACAGSPKPSSSPSPASALKTFTSKTYHFSVSYDARSFRFVENLPSPHFTGEFEIIARQQPVRSASGYTDIVVIRAASSPTAAQTLAADVRAFQKSGIQVVPISFAGLKAYRDEVVAAGQHWTDVLLVHTDTYYRITATSPARRWRVEGPSLMAIVKSFKVID